MIGCVYLQAVMLLATLVAGSVGCISSGINFDVSRNGSQTGALMVKCSVDHKLTKSMSVLTSLSVYGSRLDRSQLIFHHLASVDLWSRTPDVDFDLKAADVTVKGDVGQGPDQEPFLVISWGTRDARYLQYKCVARGKDTDGKDISLLSEVKSAPERESCCKSLASMQSQLGNVSIFMENVINTTGELSSQIQALAATVKEMDTKLDFMRDTMLSEFRMMKIDRSRYDVSGVHNDRVYLASKSVETFNLANANSFCRAMGGYLVELDDAQEYRFVFDFVSSIRGTNNFWTGGNDADREGHFVYYNSKKPVPNLTWVGGQPDNGSGTEDCMQINLHLGGLNDDQCYNKGKYVCEVPLTL